MDWDPVHGPGCRPGIREWRIVRGKPHEGVRVVLKENEEASRGLTLVVTGFDRLTIDTAKQAIEDLNIKVPEKGPR